MHKTIRLSLALIAALTWLPACGSDDSNSGTTATDTATANDTTSGSDATTGDDATTGGDSTTAGDTTATASYGKGCTADDDKAFRTLLSTDADKGKEFTGVVKDCTLTKGCLAKGSDKEAQDCIRDCILDAQISKDGKLTSDCAACYGTYKGHCGAKKCIAKCAVDAGSADCSACLKENCDPFYDLCVEGDK